MSVAERVRANALVGRWSATVAAIAERTRRVRDRTAAKPAALQISDILMLSAAIILLIAIVGLGLDGIAVVRARAVPGFIRELFWFLSEAGKSQWELYPAGIALIVLLCGRWSVVPWRVRVFWAEIGALVAYCFCAIAGAGIAVNIIKQFIGRARPNSFDALGPLALRPFRFGYDFQSFPSGHAATAGALIAIGFLVLPAFRLHLLILALAIAASRVVVIAHYPSDILAGLLFGYGFSLWLAGRFAAAGWAFARTSTGSIRARNAGIRFVFRAPARVAVATAGLLDALAGRPIWIPALQSIGDGTYDVPRIRRDRLDDE
jgi:undecaprenyl-diphosphatase